MELKQGNFKPEYKGQMALYLRWLAEYEAEPGEESPVGIVLCAGKNTEQIELPELGSSGIHVAKSLQFSLPLQPSRRNCTVPLKSSDEDRGQRMMCNKWVNLSVPSINWYVTLHPSAIWNDDGQESWASS